MGTLGETDIGGSVGSVALNNEWAYGPYEATESGNIDSISFYTASGGGNLRLAVYKDTGAGYPGELVAFTAEFAMAAGWNTAVVSSGGAIVSGESYYIAHCSSASQSARYAAGTKEVVFAAKTYGTFSDPFLGGGTQVASRDYSAYLTYSTEPTITIESPIEKQLIQRSGDTAEIAIAGTAFGFTGAIEARFAGGQWQTIDTIIGNGAYSGTLTGQALAAGTLEVRSAENNDISASVEDLMTGRLYLVTGDSNAEGRLTNAQSRNSVNAVVFREDDAWAFADDPTDTGTTDGSVWPLVSQLLTAHLGHPVGFITTATGSRDIAGGDNYYMKPNAGWGIITSQVTAAGGVIEAVLASLGVNAAVGDTLTQAEYVTAIEEWAADLRADVQAAVPVYIGVPGKSAATTAGNPKMRRAIAEAIADGTISCGPNNLGPMVSTVHPTTDAEAIRLAARWYAALIGVAAPRITRARIRESATEVDLYFNSQLGNSGDAFTVECFTVDGDNPTSATRIGSSRIRLVFATDRSVGQTVVYMPGEEHLTATMPTSVALALPVTIHSVSSVVQPADPVQLTLEAAVARRSGGNVSLVSPMVQ